MFLGGAEEIAIEGEACEKSKPRVLSIAIYCVIAVVAHFFAQDIGGCIALSLLGGLLYYYYRHPTHLSITLAIAISVATLLMTGLIWMSVLMTLQMEIWLADSITKFEFTLYVIDCAASCIAVVELLRVFDSPTSGGPRSFLPRWTSYGGGDRAGPVWNPFQGPGQTLGAEPAQEYTGGDPGKSPTQSGSNPA